MTAMRDLTGVRILLVEDDHACRESVKKLLERNGAVVTAFPDAEQAMEPLAREEYAVLITDLVLPGMDGIDMLRRVREHRPDLPVILITGFASVNSAVEALKLGAEDYILKPFESQEKLIGAVWRAQNRYQLQQQNRQLQEQLRESEETFRALFNNTGDAVFLHGLSAAGEPEPCTEVNLVACRRLDQLREDLVGRTLMDLAPPEARPGIVRAMQDLLHGGNNTIFDTVLLTSRGARVPVEIGAHRFALRGRNVVLSIARDITERLEMERRIAEASERERLALGKDLHDVLAQDLASMDMLVAVLKDALPPEAHRARADAALAQDIARRAVQLTRRLCSGLYPVELERGGLAEALDQLAVNTELMFHRSCHFSAEPGAEVKDSTVALQLYRIAQEAVTNAVKHSGGRTLELALGRREGGMELTVEDDGRGFTASPSSGGLGLHIMRYRARMAGVTLEISARDNGGTRVCCHWR